MRLLFSQDITIMSSKLAGRASDPLRLPPCRTCAERAKLKMRTVHVNTDLIHDLVRELVLEIGFCTARVRPTSQLGLLVSNSVS